MRPPIPTARLLRASGQPLDGRGVTPDVVDDAPLPRQGAALSVACPNVASPGAVSDDPLVRRAAGLLITSADAR